MKRVMALGIKGIYGGRIKVFTFSQELEIVSYKQLDTRSKEHDPRKIKIIETYLELKSGRQTAKELKISRDFVLKAIREYTLDKHITVESKINKGHE
jgi:DNA invertase Pin-like site-specific DNA recombinase